MSVKKNLTVATLAALLAVPAFSASNINHYLHIPSVINVNADSVTTNRDVTGIKSIINNNGRWAPGAENWPSSQHINIPAGTPVTIEASYSGGAEGEAGEIVHPNGYSGSFLIPSGAISTSTSNRTTANDVPNRSSVNEDNTDTSNGYNQNTTANNTNNTNRTNKLSSDGTNNSTQYTSKNSLPQTGENDGTSKAMAIGAVALGASASLMALSIARKHKQDADLETVTPVEPSVNSGNDKDDTKSNADKSVYNMIMSDTFKNISNDLKQM